MALFRPHDEAVYHMLRSRRTAYGLAFSTPAGQEVLRDLAKFCRANKTCFDEDSRLHAVAEGRREVFLRIANHMHLTTEELYELLGGRMIRIDNPNQENDDD